MATTLLGTRLISWNRIGSVILYNLNESPWTATKNLYHDYVEKLPLRDNSSPLVYFVPNDDIPHSMFVRFAKCPSPPYEYCCNRFMREMSLDPPITQPAVARHCLAQMILRGTEPDLITFTILVKSYCKDLHLTHHHVHHLVFKQMKAVQGVEPDVPFYETLIDAVCARFGPVVGYQFLKEVISSCLIQELQLPLSCYNSVARHFCKRKMIGDASIVLVLNDFLMYMKQQRLFPDEKIVKCLLKGRGHGGENFLKAVSIGGQMFALAVKIKAVSCIVVKK